MLVSVANAQAVLPDSISSRLAKRGSPAGRVDALNDASWYLRHNDPQLSMDFALRARDLADSISYEKGLGWAYRNEAVVEYIQGSYADALTSNLEALRIFKRLNATDGIAATYINIGLVHWQIGNDDKALRYFKDALALRAGAGINAAIQGNIGLIHADRGEYNLALYHTREGLQLYREVDNQLGVSTMLNNIGWIYELQERYAEALRRYEESLAIRIRLGDKRRIASVSVSIASILRKMGEYGKALRLLDSAETQVRSIGDRKQIEAVYEEKSDTYAAMGDFEQAYRQHLRYTAIRDSIVDERKAVDIAKLEANFRVEQAQREVALLTRTNDLQQTIVYITSAGLVLVLVFSVIAFMGYRSKSRINRRLEKTQKQLIIQEKLASLGQLTAGIAHEIQNPLNFIKNFSEVSRELLSELEAVPEDTEERATLEGELRTSIEKIHEHGVRAEGIVRSMMLHARQSSEELQLVEINTLLSYVIDLATHGTIARKMHRQPVFDARLEPLLPSIRAVPQDLSQVFLNIINNAVDSLCDRDEHERDDNYQPRITILTDVRNRRVEIHIRDNGKGIPEAVRGRIFEPFFTTKASGKGTGLGLSISYDLIVQKYGGDISVQSKEGEFTEFTIALPVESPS